MRRLFLLTNRGKTGPTSLPTPGSAVLSGAWTDQGGRNPQWAQSGAPSYSLSFPAGWTPSVGYQFSLDGGTTWIDSGTLVDGYPGVFPFAGFDSGSGVLVQYQVILTHATLPTQYGDWKKGNGDIGSDAANVAVSWANISITGAGLIFDDSGNTGLHSLVYAGGSNDWLVDFRIDNPAQNATGLSSDNVAWGTTDVNVGAPNSPQPGYGFTAFGVAKRPVFNASGTQVYATNEFTVATGTFNPTPPSAGVSPSASGSIATFVASQFSTPNLTYSWSSNGPSLDATTGSTVHADCSASLDGSNAVTLTATDPWGRFVTVVCTFDVASGVPSNFQIS